MVGATLAIELLDLIQACLIFRIFRKFGPEPGVDGSDTGILIGVEGGKYENIDVVIPTGVYCRILVPGNGGADTVDTVGGDSHPLSRFTDQDAKIIIVSAKNFGYDS